jgi:hypothetical protein
MNVVNRLQTTRASRRPMLGPYASQPKGQIYWGISFPRENSKPPYERLSHTIQVIRRPPATQAMIRLNGMTAVKANWEALGSEAPNEKAKELAFRVLTCSYTKGILEPTLVTASAEGGVGIVYKDNEAYAAIECLNRGNLQLLWFDEHRTPQSRRILKTKRSIDEALEQIAALHAHA